MRGSDLVSWRKQHSYSQESLMRELDIGSRQTISNWENSGTDIPRLVELAVIALEQVPSCRRIGGSKTTAQEKRAYFKTRES